MRLLLFTREDNFSLLFLSLSVFFQMLLNDIAGKEEAVQKVSANAQHYQQAVKVRSMIPGLWEFSA